MSSRYSSFATSHVSVQTTFNHSPGSRTRNLLIPSSPLWLTFLLSCVILFISNKYIKVNTHIWCKGSHYSIPEHLYILSQKVITQMYSFLHSYKKTEHLVIRKQSILSLVKIDVVRDYAKWKYSQGERQILHHFTQVKYKETKESNAKLKQNKPQKLTIQLWLSEWQAAKQGTK